MEPVTPELYAKVMAMELELDEEPLTVVDCYKLQPERAAALAAVAEGLTADNGVAVTCKDEEGNILETVVTVSADGECEHCVFTDPVMYSETSVAGLVEAQFVEGGPWVLSRATMSGVDGEKASLFKVYEGKVTEDPPECLSTLRRMLQAGPITSLYTGGGNKFVASHEGFALRMPAEVRSTSAPPLVTAIPVPASTPGLTPVVPFPALGVVLRTRPCPLICSPAPAPRMWPTGRW
jgi:hypothetical protein